MCKKKPFCPILLSLFVLCSGNIKCHDNTYTYETVNVQISQLQVQDVPQQRAPWCYHLENILFIKLTFTNRTAFYFQIS